MTISREVKTAILVILGLLLIIFTFNYLKGQNLLDTNTRYFNVEYKNIAGLSKASLVTINGLKVGKVVEIEFNKEAFDIVFTSSRLLTYFGVIGAQSQVC